MSERAPTQSELSEYMVFGDMMMRSYGKLLASEASCYSLTTQVNNVLTTEQHFSLNLPVERLFQVAPSAAQKLYLPMDGRRQLDIFCQPRYETLNAQQTKTGGQLSMMLERVGDQDCDTFLGVSYDGKKGIYIPDLEYDAQIIEDARQDGRPSPDEIFSVETLDALHAILTALPSLVSSSRGTC